MGGSGAEPPEDLLKRAWSRLGQVVLTVIVTSFIFRSLGLDLDQLRTLDTVFESVSPPLVLLASVVMMLGLFVSGLLWGRVARDLGATSLTLVAASRVFLIANLGRYVPGKVWQVTGLALLANRRGVPAAVSGISAFAAHGASLVGATLVGAWVLVRPPGGGTWGIPWLPPAMIGVVGVSLAPPIFDRAMKVLATMRVPIANSGLRPGSVVRWLGLFVIHWGIYGTAFAVFARGFGLSGGTIEVASAYVAAYVVGYVAVFAPAGLGVREASLTALLAPVMGEAPAAGLAVAARVWSTIVEVLPAAVLWLVELRRSTATPSADSPTRPDGPR